MEKIEIEIARISEQIIGIGRTLSRIEKNMETDREKIDCNSHAITEMRTQNKVFSAIIGVVASIIGGLIGFLRG